MTGAFDPFARAPGDDAPRWFSIDAHRPFLSDLAAALLDWSGRQSPEMLSDAMLLLPNRRAVRSFEQALLAVGDGRPVLMPQVRALGDLEEDEAPFTPGALGLDLPPAISPLHRRFEMARMIVEEFDSGLSVRRALDLARTLGAFLESCQIEEIEDPGRVAGLVEGDLADHWREQARFLGLAVEAWPKRLAALGLVDPAWRRGKLLRLRAEHWTDHPPATPVLAAGSTGTVPAAAAVLRAVAEAPRGAVIVPGLDRALPDDVWDKVDDLHPQAALKILLERSEVARADVRPWPVADPVSQASGQARERVLNEALRPAETTGDWRTAISALRAGASGHDPVDPVVRGLEGLTLLDLPDEETTAATIALAMRQALEVPGRTCALVTPDLDLGRRVAARLERWGIRPDNSAGVDLRTLAAGRLVDLVARWMERPLDAPTLLSLLKHPRVRPDLSEDAVGYVERHGFRGAAPRDWSVLRHRLMMPKGRGRSRPDDAPPEGLAEALALVDRLESLAGQMLQPFSPTAPLDQAALRLVATVEALGGPRVWAGPDGDAASALLAELIEAGAALGAVTRAEFRLLVGDLLGETTVRQGGATHPRLRILGAIEGRLVRSDRMILAGLEETIWPPSAPVDPFLSRPMRKTMGLPSPEKRIGQSAQDFVQAASAPEALLVHCQRRGGQPTVRSRWLWRLQMLASGASTDHHPVTLTTDDPVRDWSRMLDAPPNLVPRPAPRPAPRPPVEQRPRSLYVTRIERWIRDPYALYAQWILGLESLDRPGQPATAMERGNAIHAAIEALTVERPDDIGDDFAEVLAARIVSELVKAGFDEAALAREQPLAEAAARWLADQERGRRARTEGRVAIHAERRGRMTLTLPGGDFVLQAYADRIETWPGGAAVLDFKTGMAPTKQQVEAGLAPQLTLTAAILEAGGFGPDIGRGPVAELAYVRPTGRGEGGEWKAVAAGPEDTATATGDAMEGLTRRIASFDRVETPYVSWAVPKFMSLRGGNYDHLARVWEWHVMGAADEGEGG